MSTANKFIRAIKETWGDEGDGFVVYVQDALDYANRKYGFDIKEVQDHELAWNEALRTVKRELNIKKIM